MKRKNLKLLISSCLVLTFFSAASFYTYAYLKDQKSSTTNISLKKGTVAFADVISDSEWTYLGNSSTKNLSDIMEIPKQTFSPNLDIGLKNSGILGETIKNDGTPLVIKDLDDGFYNVKSGDIFMRKLELKYDGNSADFTIKLNSYDFTSVKNNFDIYCAVDYVDINNEKQNQVWFDNNTPKINDFAGTLSKDGTQQIELRIIYRWKSTVDTFNISSMNFDFKVQNYLKVVGGSTS